MGMVMGMDMEMEMGEIYRVLIGKESIDMVKYIDPSKRDCRARPRMVTLVNSRNPKVNHGACYKCGSTKHYRSTCPRLNKALGQVGNRLTIEENQNQRKNRNRARGMAFNVNANDALHDLNVVMDVKSSVLRSSLAIEVASGKKIETNRVIRGCTLVLGGFLFTIDLLPFGESEPKKARSPFMSTIMDEQKMEDILIVRNYPKVFPEDLSGLPPHRQVEFRIDLIPEATPVAKFPLHGLNEPSMQAVSRQIHILIYSKSKKDHEIHLKLILELIEKEMLFAKFSKSEKNKKYEWGGEQEEAFHTLKDNLCNALILTLLDEPDDFVKIHEKNYTTHDLELRAMAFALKNWEHYLVKDEILEVQIEASKVENASAKMLRGLDQQMEKREDGGLYFLDRLWVPLMGNVRTVNMDDAHTRRYFVHQAGKMYHDLRDMYWWSGMKKDKAIYVSKCLTCSKVKERLKAARDHQKTYADNRRKPLEFSVGEQVLLKVSPWKGVVRFGKKGKLAPRYVGPFEIVERIGPIAYRLRLPQELSTWKTSNFWFGNLVGLYECSMLHDE
nr:hypothetical protein [Tanacetum cinerariifolium]